MTTFFQPVTTFFLPVTTFFLLVTTFFQPVTIFCQPMPTYFLLVTTFFQSMTTYLSPMFMVTVSSSNLTLSPALDLDFPRKALEVFACLNPSKVITLPNFPDEEAEDEAPDELF